MWGGKDWPPPAYSPKTRLFYIPANENLCQAFAGEPVTYTPGQRYTGVNTASLVFSVAPGAEYIGELQAWNLDTGQKVWSHPFGNSQLWGPVLATAGGVLFAGGTNDRYFRAFDASNGKVLWEFRTGSGVTGVPVSFQIDGKQYVAIAAGHAIFAFGLRE